MVGMTTPINKLPIKNLENDNVGDMNDPIVKEVLQEMQNVAPENFYQQEQPQYIPQPQQIPQQLYQQSNIKQQNTIDYDILKNSIILLAIVFMVIYSGLYEQFNNYINIESMNDYEKIIKLILIFIMFYIIQIMKYFS